MAPALGTQIGLSTFSSLLHLYFYTPDELSRLCRPSTLEMSQNGRLQQSSTQNTSNAHCTTTSSGMDMSTKTTSAQVGSQLRTLQAWLSWLASSTDSTLPNQHPCCTKVTETVFASRELRVEERLQAHAVVNKLACNFCKSEQSATEEQEQEESESNILPAPQQEAPKDTNRKRRAASPPPPRLVRMNDSSDHNKQSTNK